MEKILFETEEEAENFLEENEIDKSSMKNLIENDYIKESILEKAEKEYNNYKFEKRDRFHPRADLSQYLRKDKKLIDSLYQTIQYLKKKLEEKDINGIG